VRRIVSACLSLVLLLAGLQQAVLAFGGQQQRGPILDADRRLDAQTSIAPSTIPRGGSGLFAKVRIRAGDVIGELGGQLVDGPDLADPSAYMMGLTDCAFMKVPPYLYLDARQHGGHVSRANFAPRRINGRETGFQNAAFRRLCDAPYVQVVALVDIEPGAEIWVSYGPNYNYGAFMDLPAVRDFFCGLLSMDCRQAYTYEP
jgi:hypothetical protein